MSHAYFDDRYTSKDSETKKNLRKVNYQEKLNISEVFHLEVAASWKKIHNESTRLIEHEIIGLSEVKCLAKDNKPGFEWCEHNS